MLRGNKAIVAQTLPDGTIAWRIPGEIRKRGMYSQVIADTAAAVKPSPLSCQQRPVRRAKDGCLPPYMASAGCLRARVLDGLKRLVGACPGVLQLAYRLRARRTLGERCGA